MQTSEALATLVERREFAGAEDGLDVGVAAGFAEGLDLVVERLPVAVQHHVALDDDVDLLGAVGDRGLDLREPGLERREPVREGGGDRRDRNAGALERLDRGRDEGVVDADGSGMMLRSSTPSAVEDIAAAPDGAPWRRAARRGRACRRN